MRKILIYFAGFLLLFFIMPVICTVTPSKEEKQEVVATTEQSETQYEYQKYKTIKIDKYLSKNKRPDCVLIALL